MSPYPKLDSVYKVLAEDIFNYLQENKITYFKAKHLYPVFKDKLPNGNKIAIVWALAILHAEGKIQKWAFLTWKVVNNGNRRDKNG